MRDSIEGIAMQVVTSDGAPPQALTDEVSTILEDHTRMEDLGEARRRFLEEGTILDTVRPVVLESWKRCQKFGVNPENMPRQTYCADRLQKAQAENRELLESAEPVIRFVHDTIHNQPHIIALIDRNGIVLRLLTDPETQSMDLEAANLFEGASWHESDVGCNGGGSCLAVGNPLVLIGPEHFMDAYIDWTCIGLPIHNAEGEVVGALDLSFPNEHIKIRTWGWMLSVAREVENRLHASATNHTLDPVLDDLQNPLNAVRGVLTLLASQVDLAPSHADIVQEAIDETAEAEQRFYTAITRLREANRNMERFLAMLAHEMMGPLNALRMSNHLIAQKSNDEHVAHRLNNRSEQLITQLLRLVEDLRDVSGISEGKIQLDKKQVNLSEVIDQAIETVRTRIAERGHELSVEVAGDPLFVLGDRNRLVQILTNLLTNAAKYTEPEGRIWLRASREQNTIAIRVRDNGVGIPAELQSRLFDLFVQVDGNRQGGLGIGLNLVRRLVEMHGGEVTVHSDGPGTGSEFVVRLPAHT